MTCGGMAKAALPLCLALSAPSLVGCGQDHKPRTLVKDFMEEHMGLGDADIVEWSAARPAYRVSAATIQAMRHDAERTGLVGKGTKYAPMTDTTSFIQVRYAVDTDTVSRTFYLDAGQTGVVGVKGD